MIDTVTFGLGQYDLERKNLFEIQPGRRNCEGQQVSPDKRFCNLPHFNIDIKPDGMLYYKTSFPHLIHNTSLFEVKESDYEKCLEKINENLALAGVLVPVEVAAGASIHRVDFCRNIEVDHNIFDYLLLLNQFTMSRRDKLDFKKETLYFRNKSRELTIYNKVRAINTDRRLKAERIFTQGRKENILRFESRYRVGKSVRAEFGRISIGDIFKPSLSRSILLAEISELIRSKSEQLELHFEENSKLLDHIKSQRSRNVLFYFLSTKGVCQFLTEFQYDYSLVKEFLSEHFEKSQVYEGMRLIRELHELSLPKESKDLLAEIKYKIAA